MPHSRSSKRPSAFDRMVHSYGPDQINEAADSGDLKPLLRF